MSESASGTVQNLDIPRLGGMHYRAAVNAADYAKCHALARGKGLPQTQLTFPTVMAFKEGELVGFLGTMPHPNMILAGPLVLREGQRRHFTALRLLEGYDHLMRKAGVVTYVTFVGREDLATQAVLENLPDTERHTENFDGILFIRRLP